jgi:hypothetical protein
VLSPEEAPGIYQGMNRPCGHRLTRALAEFRTTAPVRREQRGRMLRSFKNEPRAAFFRGGSASFQPALSAGHDVMLPAPIMLWFVCPHDCHRENGIFRAASRTSN